MNQNTLWWKLFPFSLIRNVNVWYNRTVGRAGGHWIKLKDEFCLFFFPVSKVIPHRMELLSFKQDDGEPHGAVWARFMQSVTSGPPHNVQEQMLMQHFIYGLNLESAHFMNLASEGSIIHKTVAEVRTILERVLNTTQYMGVFDDSPKPEDKPKEKQQLYILSDASSPPHKEEITEPANSPDHEPLIKDIPMFIPDLFTEEEYMELSNVSAMPKEHK